VLPDTVTWLTQLVRADQPISVDVPDARWPALIAAARDADVLGLVAERVLASRIPLPDNAEAELRSVRQLESRHHGFHFVEAERIAAALLARGVPFALLKGAALARVVYAHPVERSFRDLDFLVAEPARDAALDALAALDYAPADPEAVRAAQRETHFHVALAGHGKPRVELHWALVRPEDPYEVDPSWLLDGARVPEGAPPVPCPPPEGQVLHAAATQVRCGFTQLKRLIDVDRIVRRGAVDWERVATMARAGRLAPAVRLLLELTGELLATPLDVPLSLLPPLGPARHRLDELGIAGFPFGLPPSAWGPARHLVRYWVSCERATVVRQFVFATPFERARLRALGVGRGRELAATGKRMAVLAVLPLWQLALRVAPHRRNLSSLHR